MRLITSADEQLFQAVSLAGKLGRAKPLLDRFEERYESEWDNPEVAFPFALSMMAALPTTSSDFEVHAGFSATIETLGEVITATPEHWLARYCRARLRALIPTSYSVYTIYTANELAKAVEDLDELIERQSALPWEPYFACPYVLAAFVTRLENEAHADATNGARIPLLIAEVAARPRVPVRFSALGAVLCEPFVALYDLSEEPDRGVLADLMTALFPAQSAVAAALARQPVR